MTPEYIYRKTTGTNETQLCWLWKKFILFQGNTFKITQQTWKWLDTCTVATRYIRLNSKSDKGDEVCIALCASAGIVCLSKPMILKIVLRFLSNRYCLTQLSVLVSTLSLFPRCRAEFSSREYGLEYNRTWRLNRSDMLHFDDDIELWIWWYWWFRCRIRQLCIQLVLYPNH